MKQRWVGDGERGLARFDEVRVKVLRLVAFAESEVLEKGVSRERV